MWSATAALGVGLGPLLGGLLIDEVSWQWVFWINVPVALVALVAGLKLVPQTRDPRPGAFDLAGAALSIAALVALVYAIIEAPTQGWTHPRTVAMLAAAGVLGAAFAVWERRTPDPMLDLSVFRNPRFSIASLAVSGASFAMMAAAFLLTQYLQFAHGYSALGAGAAMTPLALGLLLGAAGSHRNVTKFGTTKVLTTALLGVGTVLAASLFWSSHVAYWAIGLTIFGLALSLGNVLAPATESIMNSVSEEKAGVGSAMNDVTRQVAGALGVAVVGSIATTVYQDRVGSAMSGLAPGARETAEGSVGGAHAVAGTLPPGLAQQVTDAAGSAFTEALGIGLAGSAAVAVAVAAIVARRLPPRDLPVGGARPAPAAARPVRQLRQSPAGA
jgi:Na+/melibiose symporter-like transporter